MNLLYMLLRICGLEQSGILDTASKSSPDMPSTIMQCSLQQCIIHLLVDGIHTGEMYGDITLVSYFNIHSI